MSACQLSRLLVTFEVELVFVPVGQYPIYLATPMVLGLFSVVCVFVGLYFLRTKIKNCSHQIHILRLKCTKIDFFWGSAPDPAGGADSAPPDSLDLRGPTSKGGAG